MRRVTGGNGGVEEQEVGQTARYVRVLGLRRATPYGISLYELQVFDSDGQLISQGKRATASSVEDQVAFALWFRFWPLLLVAGGLPLLLAPRNDANQVFGLVLTAMGAFLQLQNLGLVPWGVRADLGRRPDPGRGRDPAPVAAAQREDERNGILRGRVVREASSPGTARNRTTLGLVLIIVGLVLALDSAGVLRTDGLGRWWPLAPHRRRASSRCGSRGRTASARPAWPS